MGRLALRAGWESPDLDFVHVNELHGDAATAAHLLEFDSVHGRWPHRIEARGRPAHDRRHDARLQPRPPSPARCRGASSASTSCSSAPGAFRTRETLEPYFEHGVRKVVVAAPGEGRAR